MLKTYSKINASESPATSQSRVRACHGNSSLIDQLASHLRMLPDFVIIGAMKCGTTSLYDYLAMHPEVAPATEKEIHFFDNNFEKGLAWYCDHFPPRMRRWWARMNGRRLITGEASPYYMFHPQAPNRMHEVIPRTLLIVLLRNPIERAYSHYQHQIRQGREKETFEDAIRLETKRLSHDLTMMEKDEYYVGFHHQHFSYLARGVYVDQLLAFERYYPKGQTLILQTENLFQNPDAVYGKTLEFLGLRPHPLTRFQKSNAGGDYSKLSRDTREKLNEFYAPHNERLYEYLGYELNW